MLVARELKENGIITDEEKTKKVILQGLPTIIRIAEKLWPENHDPEHLENASSALYKGVENPLHILKQAGIDIEPELEEFRQFLAEISGKRARTAGKSQRRETSTPKFKQIEEGTGDLIGIKLPESLKLEVLSILQALEFADYSEEAREKALQKLSGKIDKLSMEKLTPENLLKLGLYTFTIKLIKRGEFERIGEIQKL